MSLYDHHPVMKISKAMFEKLLDEIDSHCERLREDLQAPYLSRRFAEATSVQLTLIDISDDQALSTEIRERAAALLARLERRASASVQEPN